MHCLITGASGFIGRALLPHLTAAGHAVKEWPRSAIFDLANAGTEPSPEWVAQLHGVDVVVHLAGLAHQPRGGDDERYFRINRDGTLHLAAAARRAGVRRFIFMSSAKVFGEGGDSVYRATSAPAPQDAYAESKWQAEQLLLERHAHDMDIVILRPPLIYSRDAKANFASLMRLASLSIPLPFAGIDNRRAMIGLDNLVDLIVLCLTHPAAAGKTLPCADARHYSLADTVSAIRRASNREPQLFRLPLPLLAAIKRLLGERITARLFGDFRMDCSSTFALLDWQPRFTMEQILRDSTKDSVA